MSRRDDEGTSGWGTTNTKSRDGWVAGSVSWEGMRSGVCWGDWEAGLEDSGDGYPWLFLAGLTTARRQGPTLCAAWGLGRLTCVCSCVSCKARLWLKFESRLCFLIGLWPQVGFLALLNLFFSPVKGGTNCWKDQMRYHLRVLAMCLMHNKSPKVDINCQNMCK